MRYIGNKEKLIERIYQEMLARNVVGKSFFDVFSGTTNVAKFFKKLDYKVISADIMYYSYVLQKAYVENNSEVNFAKLSSVIGDLKLDDVRPSNLKLGNVEVGNAERGNLQESNLSSSNLSKVLAYLNNLESKKGFIYDNYTPEGTSNLVSPRMYYTGENGVFIDKVRMQIEDWYQRDLLTESEYFILLASLIETVPFYANISGVYAAFNKKWDPRALKPMYLREPEIILNAQQNECYQGDAVELIDKVEADIFYLDPPYNKRQYAPNYHLLETIAKYDSPEIKGVSGMRDYSLQKSKFCNALTALDELEKFVKYGKYKHLVLSYNNEGIMPEGSIIEVLKSENSHLEVVDFDYLRFKSNKHASSQKQFIKEKLYILSK
ncbi:DNA methyltransferase [Psittacicella hinzii]|uniref:DNA methyltransferase n=1 Tax=Psittacicella hinzii TaxID=2028575 RepID=A0A3A1Y1F1_9GAMM|nr:DNA adenine methylase [Psittacicella hinzii]RIY31119.1 DNA methyltransferase [Psittacicella hinzii]